MRKNSIKIKTLELIKNSNGISRSELAKELDITPAGVGKVVNRFLENGIIEETSIGRFNWGATSSYFKDK